MARTLTKEADGLPPTPTNSGPAGDQPDRSTRRARATRSANADPPAKARRVTKAQAPAKAQRATKAQPATTAQPAAGPQPRSKAPRRSPAESPRTLKRSTTAAERATARVAVIDADLDGHIEDEELRYDEILGNPAPWLVRIVVGLVIVILAFSVVFLGLKVRHQDSLNSLRSSALTAASTYGGYVSSYDYRNLTAPNSPYVLAEKNSTPSFAAKLQSVESSFDSALKQLDSTSSGKVEGAGISSVSSSTATAVLFIEQTTSSSVQKTPVTQPLWLQMTLVRQHGRWVISDITADT